MTNVELKPEALDAEVGEEQAERFVGVQTVVRLEPVLLNERQVCAMLGNMSGRHLRALVSAGKFPQPISRKLIGRLTRWKLSDVQQWAAQLR